MKQMKKDIHEIKDIEQRIATQFAQQQGWQMDRRISITNICTLLSIVIFGVSFYYQTINNQKSTDEKFSINAEERKLQAVQMLEMQKGQNEMLIQLTKINERQDYLTDTVKDISSTIKARSPK